VAVVGSAYVVVSAITTGFNSQVNNAANSMQSSFGNAGKNSGRSFAKNFAGSLTDFDREAMAAHTAINELIKKSYYLQGALGLAIPAIGAVAGGLSVMAFQAAAAAPSFIALGGVLAGLVQGMIGVKLAFGGIGKAVGAITKPGSGVDRLPQLFRAARDAEEAVTDALEREKKVREALIEVYEASRREIRNLKYETEDAEISEQRAVIGFEKARQALLRVQDLPPNSRARREAELSYKEADLNLRRSRSSFEDLRTDLNKVTQNGKLNTDEQVANSQRVVDANKAIADATKATTRANENKLLADKELADAKAGKGGGGGDPFAGLNDFQIEFAKFLAGLKPRIDTLKIAVSEGFLPALQNAIDLMDKKLFPILERRLKETGVALGKASMDFAKAITSPAASANLDTVLGTGNYVISRAGEIIGNLARLLLALLAAADPLIRRFTDFIERLTGGWADSAEENMSGLTDMFNRSGDIAAAFGTALGNIVGAFINIGKAIAGSGGPGDSMTGWLINITQRFEDFTAKHLADGKLQEYFQTAFDGFKQILIIVGNIVAAIFKTGGEESFEGSVKTVGEGVSAVLEKMPELIAGGVAFAGFVSNFLVMTAAFLESGSVTMFFDVVSRAAGAVGDFLSIPIVSKIFGLVASFHGLRLGISAVANVLDFFVIKYVKGAYLALAKLMMSLTNTTTMFAAMASPIGLVVIAIAAIVAIFAIAYLKSEALRDAVSRMGRVLMGEVKEAFDKVLAAINEVLPAVESTGDIFKEIGDFLATYIVPIIQIILVGAIETAANTIIAFIKIVAGITLIFKAVFSNLKGLFALFTGDIDGVKKHFGDAFSGMFNGLKKIFGGVFSLIVSPFKQAFNAVARIWNATIGGKFGVPKIPLWNENDVYVPPDVAAGGVLKFARGGTVYPSSGGSLVRVAEAGRPERIEPLNDAGLSKRDIAMIRLMSGGGGGQTFNVYPAPKMDEEELAALVSRQLAFQLRAGSV
jgi:phage-related protein